MALRRPLAASAAVIAALATASPAATANIAPPTVRTAAITNSFSLSDYLYATCPSWYGFKNPAVGCTSWADYFRYAVWGPSLP